MGLRNAALICLGHITPMTGSLINNELKRIWQEEVMADLKYYPGISLQEVQKIMKNLRLLALLPVLIRLHK